MRFYDREISLLEIINVCVALCPFASNVIGTTNRWANRKQCVIAIAMHIASAEITNTKWTFATIMDDRSAHTNIRKWWRRSIRARNNTYFERWVLHGFHFRHHPAAGEGCCAKSTEWCPKNTPRVRSCDAIFCWADAPRKQLMKIRTDVVVRENCHEANAIREQRIMCQALSVCGQTHEQIESLGDDWCGFSLFALDSVMPLFGQRLFIWFLFLKPC